MKMQFWKPNGESSSKTWLVVLGDAVFEMSENALDANGVNMYSGPESDLDRSWISGSMDCVDNIREVPADIARAALLAVAHVVFE